jgi:hypothetical protein
MRTKRIVASNALCSLFLCASVFSQGPPVSSPEGLRLFHKMQDALGGADRIAAVRDFEEFVQAESWNGNTGQSMGRVTKRTRWIRPSTLRVDQIGPGSTYVLFFDGAAGWEILPGTDKVIPLEGGELEFARGYVRGFRLNTWLADRSPQFQIVTPEPDVVRISDGDITHQIDIQLDPVTWLPARLRQTTLSDPAHPRRSEEVTLDWETVHGIRFPHHWTVLRDGIKVAEAQDARHRVNTALALADLSLKPADLKPVMRFD